MARKKKSSGSSAKASRRRLRKKRGLITTRKKKEYTYRGYTIEELTEMPLDDIIALLPARSRRSLDRGMSEEKERLLAKIRKDGDEKVKTHIRDMVVLPEMVGKTIFIHNGKEFKETMILPEMIGHFLGEFALTRSSVKHTGPGVGATRSSKFMPLK